MLIIRIAEGETALGTHVQTSRRGLYRASAFAALAATLATSLTLLPGSSRTASAANESGPVLAKDTFSRTVVSGLGSADTGGPYDFYAGHTAVSVSNGAAHLKKIDRGASVFATLSKVSVADVQLRTTVSATTVTGAQPLFYHSLTARSGANGASYAGRFIVDGSGVSVAINRFGNGSDTALGQRTASFRYSPNQRVTLLFEVSGTNPVTLRAKAWPAGEAEPGWQLSVSDASTQRISKSGAVGLWDYVSASGQATDVTWDDLQALGLTGAGGAPPGPSVSLIPATSSQITATSSSPPAPPTSAPPVPPTAQPNSGRGSLPVGDAAYAIPGNALFVSSTVGSDAYDGNAGRPFRSVAHAIGVAAPGSTIVLRGGSYHENVFIPDSKVGLTIQAYPREAVWFDGAIPVSNWLPSGSTWIANGWNYQFDHSASFSPGRDDGFVGSAYPMAAWPDQVFVDGVQQRQVRAVSEVGPGRFVVDYANHRLILGTNPVGHAIAASTLTQAIVVSAPNVTLRGFGVRHYATPLPLGSAIYLARANDKLQNLVITDVAAEAVAMWQGNMTIDHITIMNAGLMGVSSNQADGSTVSNSVIRFSNWEHFNSAPASGAIKLTRSRNVAVVNNELSNGFDTPGVWLDESVVNFTIAGNTIQNNGYTAAVQAELSDTGIIANNVVTNVDTALLIMDSGNIKIFNNNFGSSPRGSVFLAQDERRETTPGGNHDPRQPIPDPTCPWLTRNVTVSNNLFGYNGGPYGIQFRALDGSTHIPASAMNLTVSGNLFHANSGSTDAMVQWGQSNGSVSIVQTPAALNAIAAKSWNNAQSPAGSSIGTQVKLASQHADIAVPLPADIAAVVRQPVGTRHLGAF